jgi:NTE family protein
MKKVALVLGGGGSNGDWETGVLLYFSENLQRVAPEGFFLYSGTSVGAVLTTYLAMFPPTDFRIAVKRVIALWRDRVVGTHSIWEYRKAEDVPWYLRWLFLLLPDKVRKYIPGLFHSSLGDNAKLKKLFQEEYRFEKIRSSGSKLRVGAIDLILGERHIWTELDVDASAVAASSSIPGLFPTENRPGLVLTDDGIREVIPIKAAIEAGAEVIYAISTRDPFKAPPCDSSKLGTVLGVLQRSVDLLYQEVLEGDIKLCLLHNDMIDAGNGRQGKRKLELHVIYPRRPLGDSIDFSMNKFEKQHQQGYADADAYFKGLAD